MPTTMNGLRKEVLEKNSILLKPTCEEEKGRDEVTEAITKLQQNGVNCIIFTKDELQDIENNHRQDILTNIQMTQENEDLDDLLDYQPNIKSINSSIAIQLSNHDCLLHSKQIGKIRRRRRKGGQNSLVKKKGNSRSIPKKRNYKATRESTNSTNHYHLRRRKAFGDAVPNPKHSIENLHERRDLEKQTVTVVNESSAQSRLSHYGFEDSGRQETQAVKGERADIALPISSKASLFLPLLEDLEITQEVSDTMMCILEAVTKEEIRDEATGLILVENKVNSVQEIDSLKDAEPEFSKAGACLENGSLTLVPLDSAMKIHHSTLDSSFYSLVTNNVRHNLENYLDGRTVIPAKKSGGSKRRKRYKNGYLLQHGDNYPNQPELSYKLNLTTQILLKLNNKRFYKPKIDKRKTLLSYLNLIPKRPVRTGRTTKQPDEFKTPAERIEEMPLFSGEWTLNNKYICGLCGHIENDFWDMVTHKGEEHLGVLVTHVELPVNQEVPGTLIRNIAETQYKTSDSKSFPSCTKCSTRFNTTPDLHRHIFECSGNTEWLNEQVVKKPTKPRRRRRRGFKRRLSNGTPKKSNSTSGSSPAKLETPTKRKGNTSNVFKCKFCVRHFKTEGWLKNHLLTHTLLVSIPLNKLPKLKPSLPQPSQRRASSWSLRKYKEAAVVAQ